MKDKVEKSEIITETAERHQDAAVQSWLSEYKVLQADILANSRQRYILVSLNIVSLGTLISLAITTKSPLFIAVISLVSSCLGMVWVAENRWSVGSYNYIRDRISPAMQALSKDSALFGWQTGIRKGLTYKRLLMETITGGSPAALTGLSLFFAPSAVSWGIAIYEAITKPEWQTWYFIGLLVVNGILLIVLVLSGWRWFKEWRR